MPFRHFRPQFICFFARSCTGDFVVLSCHLRKVPEAPTQVVRHQYSKVPSQSDTSTQPSPSMKSCRDIAQSQTSWSRFADWRIQTNLRHCVTFPPSITGSMPRNHVLTYITDTASQV